MKLPLFISHKLNILRFEKGVTTPQLKEILRLSRNESHHLHFQNYPPLRVSQLQRISTKATGDQFLMAIVGYVGRIRELFELNAIISNVNVVNLRVIKLCLNPSKS